MVKRLLVLFLLLTFPACLRKPTLDSELDHFLREAWWPARPSEATAAGCHDFDDQLEDWSADARARDGKRLQKFRARFQELTELSAADETDRTILLSNIDAALLELDEVCMWKKDPNRYLSLLSNSAYTLIHRRDAEPARRLRALIAREKQMPALLEQARTNLTRPNIVYVEAARQEVEATMNFFMTDVPGAFADVKDSSLERDLALANSRVLGALDTYRSWLAGLKPTGDFRLGEKLFLRKLKCEEMLDLPLDQLLQVARADLRRNQKSYREVTARLPQEPAALGRGQVLAEAGRIVRGMPDFLERHHIVTLPTRALPVIIETPPFLRSMTFATLDTPGPLEEKTRDAYFRLTLEGGLSQPLLSNVAVHEGYPGHYLQYLWQGQAPTRVRRLFTAASNTEGWAHYCEEMVLEEGYGRDTPDFLSLRRVQLQEALRRDCRFLVGIEMHRGSMTLEQGEKFFVEEGYQPLRRAQNEARRGTWDPTYLVYTLGKLEILKLRQDFRRQRGASYRIQDFHDRFLAQGGPPLRLVRQAFGLEKLSEL